jgi:hypothetical protein
MESITATGGTVTRQEIAFVDAVWELNDWAHGNGIGLRNISADESTFVNGCWELRDEEGRLVARVGYGSGDGIRVL